MTPESNSITVGVYACHGGLYVSGISDPMKSIKHSISWPFGSVMFCDNYLHIGFAVWGRDIQYDKIDRIKKMLFGCVVKIVHHDPVCPNTVYVYGFMIGSSFDYYLRNKMA